MQWNEKKNQTLMTLYNEGAKYRDIAKSIKVSKNAIVGRVHRLIEKGELFSRGEVTLPKLEPKKKEPKLTVKKIIERRVDPIIVTPPEIAIGVRLIDTQNVVCQCRFPLNTGAYMRVCGAPVLPDKSWCSIHAKIVWQDARYQRKVKPVIVKRRFLPARRGHV